MVVSYAHHIHERPEHTVGCILFGVDDVAVREGRLLLLLFYQLVFVVDVVDDFVAVFGVELRLFVHVQDPCVAVDDVMLGGVVQRPRLEQRVHRRFLVVRHHDLGNLCLGRPQINVLVREHFNRPLRSAPQRVQTD